MQRDRKPRTQIYEDKYGDWRVEHIPDDADGSIFLTIFCHGTNSEKTASEYAHFKYGFERLQK